MTRERWSALLLGVGPPLLGPQTSAWLQMGAQTTDISMGFGGNMATDINPSPGCTRTSAIAQTMGLNMASDGYTCHPHQHAPSQAAKLEDTTKTTKGSGRGADYIHPHGSQASSLPGVAA